jgi:hypothetical protein
MKRGEDTDCNRQLVNWRKGLPEKVGGSCRLIISRITLKTYSMIALIGRKKAKEAATSVADPVQFGLDPDPTPQRRLIQIRILKVKYTYQPMSLLITL